MKEPHAPLGRIRRSEREVIRFRKKERCSGNRYGWVERLHWEEPTCTLVRKSKGLDGGATNSAKPLIRSHNFEEKNTGTPKNAKEVSLTS